MIKRQVYWFFLTDIVCMYVCVSYSVTENLSMVSELQKEQQKQPVSHRCPVAHRYYHDLIR